jgi:hypothetical protein
LSPASLEQLAEYQREAQTQRQDYLINRASPIELRNAARVEAEERRAQFQREQVQQQIQSREAIDATQGYPILPAVNLTTGEKLDAAYFIKLSNTNLQLYKNFMRRYGASQITKALNERL